MAVKMRYICRFTRELDEKLIELVSKNPVLYDTSHTCNRGINIREEVWVAISSKLQKSGKWERRCQVVKFVLQQHILTVDVRFLNVKGAIKIKTLFWMSVNFKWIIFHYQFITVPLTDWPSNVFILQYKPLNKCQSYVTDAVLKILVPKSFFYD